MHKFSVSKDYEFFLNNDKRRRDMVVGQGGGTFMSNTDYQRIES